MVSEEQGDAKVEWNMAALLNMELAQLRQKANTALIDGQYRRAFDSLKAMAMTAIHVMTEAERDSLKEIEKKFEIPLMISKSSDSFNKSERFKASQAILLIRENFSRYNERVMDILDAHGFLGGYKKDSGKMKL